MGFNLHDTDCYIIWRHMWLTGLDTPLVHHRMVTGHNLSHALAASQYTAWVPHESGYTKDVPDTLCTWR